MHLRLLKHLLSTQILLSKGIRPFGPERKAIPTTMLELQKNLLSVSVATFHLPYGATRISWAQGHHLSRRTPRQGVGDRMDALAEERLA